MVQKEAETAQANACMNALLARYEQPATADDAAAQTQRVQQKQEQQQQQQEEQQPLHEASSRQQQQQQQQDDDEKDYFLHTVTPADTLGGLELRYGVSGSLIRRLNGMTSDRLNAYLHLKIPKASHAKPTHLVPSPVLDKKTEKMQILRVFRITFPDVGEHEVECYMQSANGSVREALRLCRRDIEWERKHKHLLKTRSKRNNEPAHGPEQDAIKTSSRSGISWLWKSSSSNSSSARSSFSSSSTASGSPRKSSRRKPAEDLPESAWPSVDDMLLASDPDGPRVSLLERDYLTASPQSSPTFR